MSKNLVLGLVAMLILLGGGGAALLLTGEDSGTPAPNPRLRQEARSEAAKTATEKVPESTELASSEFTGVVDDGEELALDEAGPTYALILGIDGQPVVGAKVRLTPFTGREGRGGGRPPFFGGREETQAYREVTTAKDGGALLSPLPRRRFRIEARSDDAYGQAEFVQGREPSDEAAAENVAVIVRLTPIKKVLVTVLSPQGATVGDVQVVAATGDGNPFGGRGRGGRGGDASVSGWTRAEDGQVELEITSADEGLYDAEEISVRAELPGLERVTSTTTLAERSEATVVLKAPATHGLNIHLVRTDRTPYQGPVSLEWFLAPPAGQAEGRDAFRRMFERSAIGQRRVVGGHTALGGVALEGEVVFTARVEGRVLEETKVRIDPAQVPQSVEVVVGDQEPSLTLTVVDASGSPIPRLLLRPEIVYEREEEREEFDRADPMARITAMMRRGGNAGPRRTDKDGKITFTLEPHVAGVLELHAAEGGGFRFGRGGRGRGRDNNEQTVSALLAPRFEALAPGEERDLGPQAIAETALVLAGIVVDAEGQPVAEASVTLRGESNNNGGGGEFPGFPGGGGGFGRFGATLRATTDAEGRFAIYGEAERDREWSVSATTAGAKSTALPVQVGQRDVSVSVFATGSIVGHLVLGMPGAVARDVRRALQLEAVSSDGTERERVRISDDLSFKVDQLTPGSWTLEARFGAEDAGFLDGIEVPSGAPSSDRRLTAFAVMSDFFVATVRVQDTTGTPVSRARVTFNTESQTNGDPQAAFRNMMRAQRNSARNTRTDENGEISQILRLGTRVQLEASADGYAPVTKENASFPATLVLDKGTRLVVRFNPALPRVEGADGFRLSAVANASEARGGADLFSLFGRGGGQRNRGLEAGAAEGVIENLNPGDYTVRLFFRLPPEDGTEEEGRRGPRGRMVTLDIGQAKIEKGQPEVTITVPLSAEDLLRAEAVNFGPFGPGGGGRGGR